MRPIDADKVNPSEIIILGNMSQSDFNNAVTALIHNTPTIDAVLVVHGKWVWNPNGMDWGLGAWECSECAGRNNNLPMNSKINPLSFSGSTYCPNCGAEMDLEE